MLGRGVVALERLSEDSVGRWTGWTSEIGGNGLPLALMETLALDLGFLPDRRGSFSAERFWKRPRKLDSIPPLDAEVWDL